MKKLMLLLTMICASMLYSMEPEQPSYQMLPQELKQEIIATALALSSTPYEAIQMIKKLSAIHGISYNTLSDFTALMDVLAKKFPNISRKKIANQFDLPIAKEYLKLNNLFMKNIDKLIYQLFEYSETEGKYIFLKLKYNKAKNIFNEIFNQLDYIDPNFSQHNRSYPLEKPKTILETILYNEKYLFNHPDLIPIIAALLNKGAIPDTQLIKMVEDEVTINPTNLNKTLLDLLKQAAELNLMKRIPRDK